MRKFFLKKRHDSRGMSLVELLLVMVILSVVMLAVMSLYVPAHQSTVAQSQVSDVQSNLRLALKTMTRDLLLAGFLVPNFPVVFPDASPDYYSPDTLGTENATDFVIRTRIVGDDFARVKDVVTPNPVTGGYRLVVTDSEMISKFPDGSKVRLFEPITAEEVKKNTGNNASRAYTVLGSNLAAKTLDISAGALAITDLLEETVVVGVRDENQPALQTIRYRFNNGALERIVNDATQILARNLDAVEFAYDYTDQGRVNHVTIKLTGKTKALKNDAISGAKTRTVETEVKLRNVY